MDLKSLPDEVKEFVRAQLEAGHFQSVDEVVCEALRLLFEREELFASRRASDRRAERRKPEAPLFVSGKSGLRPIPREMWSWGTDTDQKDVHVPGHAARQRVDHRTRPRPP